MTEAKKPSFNLLKEPWIPCQMNDGSTEELNLVEFFDRATGVQDFAIPSPLTRVALLRFLLAILYRTHNVEIEADWIKLWDDGWDTDGIQKYLRKWEDRFDLFSSSYPFFQRADLDLGDKETPIAKLSTQFVAGNNKQLMDHSCDDAPLAVSPAKAACLLIEGQSWCIGGGVASGGRPRFISSQLPKGASVIPLSKNLRDTLLLNLVPYSNFKPINRRILREGADDRPAWERAGNDPITERPVEGPADYLTWQYRYLRLIPKEDNHVGTIYYTMGEKPGFADKNISPVDMFHAFLDDKKKGPIPKGINPSKSVWRDSESLFIHSEENAKHTSMPLEHFRSQMDTHREVPERIPVLVAGIAIPGGQPPPDLWISDVFMLPFDLLKGSKESINRLNNALELADDVAGVLRSAMFTYASKFLEMEHGGGDPSAISKLRDCLSREADYWAALETPFHQFLASLAEQSEESMEQWKQSVRKSVEDAFEASLASQDSTGRHLRASHSARAYFYGWKKGLNAFIPIKEKQHV